VYLGVDVGGTFTDLVLLDDSGRLSTAKALTTPDRLEVGVFDAIGLVAASRGVDTETLLAQVNAFGHGTTQATNALIERDGALTGLITTRGFGDTLALQRLMGFTAGLSVDRLNWYSRRRYPAAIVPRRLVREVPERVDQSGRILLELDEESTRKAIRELSDLGATTFAVALLWSIRNPSHERRIGAWIREMLPDAYVSLSCEVSPTIGEYERTATTALNSYLAPKVVSYLERFEKQLRQRRFSGSVYVLNSAGGVISTRDATRKPVLLVASGPTGGVMGSLHLAKSLGERNVITTDMGGTSFDVALIVDGRPIMSSVHEVGGYHLATPMIDILAVGAGGGSIASVEGGLLRVGPESAGAYPGPVCYGRGGTRATVTDADVVLGIVSPSGFLGGQMKLDRTAATEAIRMQIAEPLGLSVERAAAGIRRVVDAHMADTLREVTIGRGFDPRDFVLFAYGGAGPAHCAGFASDLGVSRVVVPATSMAHSAYGALASDINSIATRSLLLHIRMDRNGAWEEPDASECAMCFEELEGQCTASLVEAGAQVSQIELSRSLDIRFRRQTHELTIAVPAGEFDTHAVVAALVSFEAAYESEYGRGAGFRDAGIEICVARVSATAHTHKPTVRSLSSSAKARVVTREIFEPEAQRFMRIDVWDWETLPVGLELKGPAVVEHPQTTLYLAPGQQAVLDATGNLSITTGGRS
jgi:N-methylhydantoinase A